MDMILFLLFMFGEIINKLDNLSSLNNACFLVCHGRVRLRSGRATVTKLQNRRRDQSGGQKQTC